MTYYVNKIELMNGNPAHVVHDESWEDEVPSLEQAFLKYGLNAIVPSDIPGQYTGIVGDGPTELGTLYTCVVFQKIPELALSGNRNARRGGKARRKR